MSCHERVYAWRAEVAAHLPQLSGPEAVVLALWWLQFRGQFTPKTTLTMVAARSGLVMDPGSKVTYNGVEARFTPQPGAWRP